jgi:hypothetical protein
LSLSSNGKSIGGGFRRTASFASRGLGCELRSGFSLEDFGDEDFGDEDCGIKDCGGAESRAAGRFAIRESLSRDCARTGRTTGRSAGFAEMVTAASAAHSGQSKVYRPGPRLSSVTLCKQFGQKTSIGWSRGAIGSPRNFADWPE